VAYLKSIVRHTILIAGYSFHRAYASSMRIIHIWLKRTDQISIYFTSLYQLFITAMRWVGQQGSCFAKNNYSRALTQSFLRKIILFVARSKYPGTQVAKSFPLMKKIANNFNWLPS